MDNNIEDTKKQLELILKVRKEQKEIIECAGSSCMNCDPDIKALTESIDILSDYKRVLKGNEILKEEKEQAWEEWNNLEQASYVAEQRLKRENEKLKNQEATARKINELLVQRYSDSISKQTIKEVIKELEDNICRIKKQYSNGGENCNTAYLENLAQVKMLKQILKEGEK